MRLAGLYLRSRRAGWALLTVALVSPVVWGLTWLLVSRTAYGVTGGGLTLLLVFGTLTAACVVGASSGSAFGDAERVAARPLLRLRFGHLLGLLLWSAFLLSIVLSAFDLDGARPEYPLLMLLRNLSGFAGLALLGARAAGAWLSWIPPFVSAVAYLAFGGSGSDVLSAWALHSYHGLHGPSWGIALALLAAGLCLVCLFGSRD